MFTLIVPLDGSSFAEQALPLATAIARTTGGRMHVVRVRASLPVSADFDGAESYVNVVAGRIESQLPGRVTPWVLADELGALHYPPPPPASIADVLARHAIEQHADLIVTTTHGRGVVQRAWLGSVADSLSRIAPVPVLLIRPADETATAPESTNWRLRHILIPLDGSAVAEEALLEARKLGERFNARYTLMRVTSPLSPQFAGRGRLAHPLGHVSPLSRTATIDYLDTMAASLRRAGLTVSTAMVEDTSPAPAIIEYARLNRVDLIALSTSGAGGIRRFLLGSVADTLIRGAETPILVCNPKRRVMIVQAEAGAPATRASAGAGVEQRFR